MSKNVVSGLVRKRRKLAGQIEGTQAMLRQLVIDLDSLDATIRLFDPDIDLEEIKPKPLPPRYHAFRGEVSRIVLTALRKSDKPMTSRELAKLVISERGLDTGDVALTKLFIKRVGACLRHLRNKKTVCSRNNIDQSLVWAIKEIDNIA